MAIDLDDPARAAVLALRKAIARRFDPSHSDLRWTPPEQLHLTLAFLGEVDESVVPTLTDTLTPPFPLAPYSLVFAGLGAFPPGGAPRVLWLGAAAGAHETIDLQRSVADRLTAAGLELERRPFHAHLTLGRWRESGAADRRAVAGAADTGEVARVVVDHVTLYQSRLSPRGSTYTALVRTALGAR